MLESIIANTSLAPQIRNNNLRRNASAVNQEDVDSLLRDTIAQVAAAENKGDLNGYNVPRLITQIKNYLHLTTNRQDVEQVVSLLLHNAEPLLAQVNSRYNLSLNFSDLLKIRKQYPNESLARLLVYLVADSNPELAPYAQRILSNQGTRSLTDPHIQYVQSIQSQIKLTSLDPAEIYTTTNEADRQYLETVERKTQENREDLRRRNYIRLANLDLEKSNSYEDQHDYLKARLKEALGSAV